MKRRDKLQEAAYLKNPETAYLVSNEKFDEKIEEMGIIGPEGCGDHCRNGMPKGLPIRRSNGL